MYCPIMSYQRQYKDQIACLYNNCAFADEAGECLIKQALQCYVAKERTEAARRDSIEDIYRNAGYTMRPHKGEK